MDGEMQTTANAGTNTNPFNPVNLINTNTKKNHMISDSKISILMNQK